MFLAGAASIKEETCTWEHQKAQSVWEFQKKNGEYTGIYRRISATLPRYNYKKQIAEQEKRRAKVLSLSSYDLEELITISRGGVL